MPKPYEAPTSLFDALSTKKLSDNDFTQPGEMIPKDAGVGDFAKYNIAHWDPTNPETAMGMVGGTVGSVKPVGVMQDLYNLKNLQNREAGNALTQTVPTVLNKSDAALLKYQQKTPGTSLYQAIKRK